MVAAQVIGNDATIALAGMNGNLDLNVMMPVIAHDLLESVELLGAACHGAGREVRARHRGESSTLSGLRRAHQPRW